MIEPTFTKDGLDSYHVTNVCTAGCGHVTKGDVPAPNVFQWRQGTMARAAFPMLSLTQVEALFISGICGFCWDEIFGADRDDDPEAYRVSDEYTSGEQYMADYINSDSNIAYLNRG